MQTTLWPFLKGRLQETQANPLAYFAAASETKKKRLTRLTPVVVNLQTFYTCKLQSKQSKLGSHSLNVRFHAMLSKCASLFSHDYKL